MINNFSLLCEAVAGAQGRLKITEALGLPHYRPAYPSKPVRVFKLPDNYLSKLDFCLVNMPVNVNNTVRRKM